MIKKLIVTLTAVPIVAAAVAAHGVVWTVANQSTIAWDAVTSTSQGTPIPAGDTVKYQVYIVKDGAEKSTAVKSGEETDLLTHTITFVDEGRWLVGVETIRIPEASPTDIRRSPITWSDSLDTTAVPAPFGHIFFEAPASAGGLGPVS